MENKKCLVAYFSRNGENYSNGMVINLDIGNTEVVADYIINTIDCDVFKIEPTIPYPIDYHETTEAAKRERSSESLPVLKNHIESVDQYDVIFLGFPIWWSDIPVIVEIFLEANDFGRKVIIPFCTHEGSSFGCSVDTISRICNSSKIINGLAINGSDTIGSKNQVVEWLSNLKI